MTRTVSLLDACRLAKLPLPVSHDDLVRTYVALAWLNIDHNLTDTAQYAELLDEGLRAMVARGHRHCAALTGDESLPCSCGVQWAQSLLAVTV